jgi:hypothetical protein
VVLALQMAMESPYIHAEMIEANEFYKVSTRYNVSSVPQININDNSGVVLGAVPQEYLLFEIIRAIRS